MVSKISSENTASGGGAVKKQKTKKFRRRLGAVREGETVYLLRATQKDLKKERNQVVPWVWLKD